MKYTQNTTFTQIPQFKTINLGVGKTTPFFMTSTYPLKTKKKIVYKLDSKEPVEVNEPENDNSDKTPHTHYETKKKTSKVKYKCSRNDDNDDNDDYIEVPGGTESVTYTDDEGNSYEVDVGDLIDYDGDDGEIEYTKGRNSTPVKMKAKSKQIKPVLNMFLMQQALRSRVYC